VGRGAPAGLRLGRAASWAHLEGHPRGARCEETERWEQALMVQQAAS